MHMNESFSFLLLMFWYIYLHLFLVPNTSSSALELGNKTDHLALLKFKESITNDPYGIFKSWNSSTHFCKWHGITCSNSSSNSPMQQQRVIELNLSGFHLNGGSISPQLGNLSFLRSINLENNGFHGDIPRELGRLSSLRILLLNNNSLSGEIPVNLTSCSKLIGLDLSWNNLIGKIPSEIGSLWSLKQFSFESNSLTGHIPPSIGNLSSLTDLWLIYNHLEGNIPKEIGRLKNLKNLCLSVNNFSGELPSFLYNMSSLNQIDVLNNHFNGSLPPNMFHHLPNLKAFIAGMNHFSGTIPNSVTNGSFLLQVLEIGHNHFVGQVPSLGKLKNLSKLTLHENSLGSNSTKDLEFLKSLKNCSNLIGLSISGNNFGGKLPTYLGNLSTQLIKLYIGNNQIYGNIPNEIGNLVNLTILAMQHNHFDGTFPSTFGKFQNMVDLDLSDNMLSGDIPISIGNLSRMNRLDLSNNMLQGSIPLSIGKCQNLELLDLSKNNLVGPIPSEVFTISSLTLLLDLSQNSFTGILPDEVSTLKNLNLLNVSENLLSGDIPRSIGECMSLVYLFLQGNSFHGTIPLSLTSLRGLVQLDLSQNHLSGSIPQSLQNLDLEYLNVSFNMLEGEVPTKGVFRNASALTVTGNNNLCGGIPELHLPPCNKHGKHHLLIAIVVSVIAFVLLLCFSLTISWMKKRSSTQEPSSDSPTLDQVSYRKLHHGTDGFSVRNMIGSGKFGTVYKGILESDDTPVAIKVLNMHNKGVEKSFIAECNALKNIRHRNLVKILTCCSSIDYSGQEFKALVFEFMANGSLESWLHPVTETAYQSRLLDLQERFNIINDVASAFHYLHYECDQAIVHCDLKPSNVLLDNSMVAHVCDFGLARLLSTIGASQLETSTIGMKGTIGYAPPEYGMGSKVSIEGDMYSFGILVLEMLTGKRPTDEMFKDGCDLRNYVEMSLAHNIFNIVDQTISLANAENCLLSLFRVGLACSVDSPNRRMSMVHVRKELNLIKPTLPSDRLMEAEVPTQTISST